MMDGYQGALLAREVRRYLLAPAERDPIPARPRRGRDTAAVHRDAAEAPATEQPSVH
jgi:hypothetical protein